MCTAWQDLPHAILLVLAAEHAMRLSWVIEARMGATFRDCTFPHHSLPPAEASYRGVCAQPESLSGMLSLILGRSVIASWTWPHHFHGWSGNLRS